MHLLFGWDLDGYGYPETASGSRHTMGEQIVGTDGLITFLQTRLGLKRPELHRAVRTARYLSLLKSIDDGTKFYSQSLANDEWATAEYLLRRRDDLVAACWKPDLSYNENLEAKFKVLAQIELADIKQELYTRGADGLAEVIHHLATTKTTADIQTLTLSTSIELLPPTWRRLFSLLQENGVVIAHSDTDCGARENDLGRLYAAILSSGAKISALSGDESILIIEAATELQAAEAVAAWLTAGTKSENEQTVIIRGSGTSMLDQACASMGLPYIGGEYTSPWRCVMQLLPLVFQVCWLPIDVKALLEFLILPSLPIPAYVARIFASSLRKEPSIAGPAWMNASTTIRQLCRDYALSDGVSEDTVLAHVDNCERDWRFWLEPQTFAAKDGASAEYLQARCKRLRQWAAGRVASGTDEIFSDLSAACGYFEQAIQAMGGASVTKPQVDRVIQAILSDGTPMPSGGAEASDWTPIYKPSQLWGAVDTVVWWGFVATSFPRVTEFWSNEERRELRSVGIELEERDLPALREYDAYLNPLRFARKKLLLVHPQSIEGKETTAHPLWHEIRPILRAEDPSQISRFVFEASQLTKEPIVQMAGRTMHQRAIEWITVPLAQRISNISPDQITPDVVQTVSSLETLIGCPFAWAMRHAGRLRAGSILALPDREQLLGIMAHAVLAQLFAGGTTMTPEEAGAQASVILNELLPQMAPSLLKPASAYDLIRLESSLVKAAQHICSLCNRYGLRVCAVECERSREDGTLSIKGKLDVVLENNSARRFIIDYKWTSHPTYKRDELSEGRAIQLAAYSWLESPHSGEYPESGYYLLQQQQLYFSSAHPFSGASHVEGSDLQQTWELIKEQSKQHLSSLRDGHLIARGIPPEDGASTDVLNIEAPCRVCEFGLLCGQRSTACE